MTKVQPDEHTAGVREIADDLLDRHRQPANEGWDGQDLIALGQLWVLVEVDDLEPIASSKMLLAHVPQVPKRGNRSR